MSNGKPEVKAVSVVLDESLLECIDQRVKGLDVNRSQYFRRLVRADLEIAKVLPAESREPVAA